MSDDAETKAKRVVHALDCYLAMFPWPQQNANDAAAFKWADREAMKANLVDALASIMRNTSNSQQG